MKIDEVEKKLDPSHFTSVLQAEIKDGLVTLVHENIGQEYDPVKIADLYKKIKRSAEKHKNLQMSTEKHKASILKFITSQADKIFQKGVYNASSETKRRQFLVAITKIEVPKPLNKKKRGKIAKTILNIKTDNPEIKFDLVENRPLMIETLKKHGISEREFLEFEKL